MATLRELRKHAKYEFQANNACIIKGPPGYGKTDLSKILFEDLKRDNPGKRVGMGVCFMATQQSVDFTGLPWRGTVDVLQADGSMKTFTITDPAIPRWFISTEGIPASCYDIYFIVIEEWGQGNEEAKRAGAEVLLHGGTPPFYAPPGSPRLALTNVDSRDGITKEYDFVINRRAEYTCVGDNRVWIEDFANKPYVYGTSTWNTLGVTKAWAERNSKLLFEEKPKKQGPWCSPRTLAMADRYTQVVMADNKGVIPHEDPQYYQGLLGKIGPNATDSYVADLKFRLELPSYQSVVNDPDNTVIPARADLLCLMAYELSSLAQPDDMVALMRYMMRKEMPKDMQMTFVKALIQRDAKGYANLPALQGWIAKNATLITLINSL